MRFVDPPTVSSPWRGNAGDDLDGLLKSFFRSEMPNPWPDAPHAEEAPVILAVGPMPKRRSFASSRFALAASVALLVGGAWLLGGAFDGDPDRPDITGKPLDINTPTANKVKGHWKHEFFQGTDGNGGVRITVEPLPDHGKKADKIKGQLDDMLP